LRRKYLLNSSRNASDFDQSLSKTAGSFPIGFTSQTAGGGATPVGTNGGGGPCPPGGPPGEPGQVGGVSPSWTLTPWWLSHRRQLPSIVLLWSA